MLKSRFFLLFAFVSILSCISCSDSIDDIGGSENYSLRVSLKSALQLQTRSGSAESEVAHLYCLVFNEEGALESRRVVETATTEIVFEKLTAGKKTLFLLANVKENGYQTTPIQIEEVTTLEALKKLYLHHPQSIVGAPQTLPMTHVQELSIPLANPSVVVDMTRAVVRLIVDNDLESDRLAEVDSVCFLGVSKESSLFEQTTASTITADTATVMLHRDSVPNVFYLMPVKEKQVSYTVFWKSKLGVTQVSEGKIVPKLDKNNSYRLRLSTGEVTEIGIPSLPTVTIDPSIGNFSAQDTTIRLYTEGGTFTIHSSSYDEVKVNYSDLWFTDGVATRAVKKDFDFPVSAHAHITSDEVRTGYVTLFNKLDPLQNLRVRVLQEGENRGPKYYVIAVAGQSNASGIDRSPYNALYDAPNARVFQFGQSALGTPPYFKRFTSTSTLDVMPLYYIAQNEDSQLTGTAKGMHLSLGKQILPHIPDDYNVLVVSSSYTGSGFIVDNSEGVYDAVQMRSANFPLNLPGNYKLMPEQGVIFNMLTDRVKYALKLNKRNRFIGVVWSQGEVDTNRATSDPSAAYPLFEAFTASFFKIINRDINREQLPEGFAGKHLWFSIDCVPVRRDWHRNVNAQYATGQHFGGYKVWNPDSYTDIPMDVKMNVDTLDDGHFGQNAFPETIVPRVINRMLGNGVIGNNPSTVGNAYKRTLSREEAILQTGNVNDVDIQQNLLVCLPFNEADSLTLNLSKKAIPAVIKHSGGSLSNAVALPDWNGTPRHRLALSLHGSGGGVIRIENAELTSSTSWSASFMLRRTDGKNNWKDGYLLRTPGTSVGLFYHRYGIESEGGYLGLAFQPASHSFKRLSSVLARLEDADFVRSYSDWTHYAVSYNHTTRACKMYMNGQLTMSKTLEAGSPVPDIHLLQLGDATAGIEGQLIDLYIWDREVTAQTLFKTYIMSYYGVTKPEQKTSKQK